MEKIIGMKFFCGALIIVSLLLGSERCYSQAFLNLNFERAHVTGYMPGDSAIPTTSALPDWTALYISSSETNVTSQVWYDGISTGGSIISIIDSNAIPYGFSPLQGNYSALLTGGPGTPTSQIYSAQISQTGLVPSGTESLLLDGYLYESPSFIVTLGGQTINMTALQTFSNYTLYGGSIPSSLAGDVETLSITEPPFPDGHETYFELDNIQFSTSSVPEPGGLELFAVGGLFLAWRRRKNYRLTFP